MGIAETVGSLEPGKLADIILVNMNDLGLTPNTNPVSNLVYSGSGHVVDTVMVNGTLLMKGKKLLTLDEESVIQRALEHSQALIDRAEVEIRPKWPLE
ncbi:MAG: amidohydrolase family protein [Candidatus Thorarchaeota archaeon]|jgi:5-methylthioadenosine/S-adenosylhomocysteine deaminase